MATLVVFEFPSTGPWGEEMAEAYKDLTSHAVIADKSARHQSGRRPGGTRSPPRSRHHRSRTAGERDPGSRSHTARSEPGGLLGPRRNLAGARPDVHRLEDVHLRGLLTLLGTDERLVLFVDRELGALRRYDAEQGTDLVEAVRALVENPASKSQAAARLHLSRPVFYDRLAKTERLLGARLDDPDIRVSLHVALLADQLLTAD